MTLKIRANNIAFQFDQGTTSKGFSDTTTASGIVLVKSVNRDSKQPKWGKVVGIGNESKYHDMSRVLIPALRWTEGLQLPNLGKVWMTHDEELIACVSKEGFKALNDYVKLKDVSYVDVIRSTIAIVQDESDYTRPRYGTVVEVGPDATDVVVGDKIIFSGANFNEDEENGIKYLYVKESEILAVVE